MKVEKHTALALPDLGKGQRGSMWVSNDHRNVPGDLSAPFIWQSVEQASKLALKAGRL